MLTKKDEATIEAIVSRIENTLSGRMDKLDGRMDKLEGRMDRLEGHMDRIENKIIDLETFQYGQRATRGSYYYPEPEHLMAPGAASIEPVQAWRRRI